MPAPNSPSNQDLGCIPVTTIEARQLIRMFINAGIVPYLKSPPGFGKSSLIADIAEQAELLCIDIRLTTCQPEDFNGIPSKSPDGKRSMFLPMTMFPLEGDVPPINPKTNKPYKGWLILLDELSSCNKSMQAASYKFILDRFVGMYKLNPLAHIVAAGNGINDNCVVEESSRALDSRMAHLQLQISVPAWLEWAYLANIHSSIISFIASSTDDLCTFYEDSAEPTFACPRTWEMASRTIQMTEKMHEMFPNEKLPKTASLIALGAVIGTTTAQKYLDYCKHYESLPPFEKVVENPTIITMPTELSIRYAMSDMLATNYKLSAENIEQIIVYVNRFPADIKAHFANVASRKKPELLGLVNKQESPLQKLSNDLLFIS